ncbi:MAG: 5-carboxymethyl-2-hydroxymuconate isomerase [Mesorhizobium amorphae]|nr:MAG: 5-carboxymethyl-2-hydroxymuconate isomerase [Mesorhizobium amorphae]
MRLLSFVHEGQECWGSTDGVTVAVLGVGADGLAGYIASQRYLEAEEDTRKAAVSLQLAELTLLPVIPRPEKIVCIMRNYEDHHQEVVNAGLQHKKTAYPPIFTRVWRSQVAHGQPIVCPRASDKLDWEGELAAIIGVGGRDIPAERALEHVAGYACYQDASIRDFQFHANAIAAGKNWDSTGGFGPWMVTSDHVDVEKGLRIEVRLNGEVVQSANTRQMIFGVAEQISYASQIMTLSPGDVFVTGSPSGVGWTRTPPRFMKPGDVCEVDIENVGVLSNPVVGQHAAVKSAAA